MMQVILDTVAGSVQVPKFHGEYRMFQLRASMDKTIFRTPEETCAHGVLLRLDQQTDWFRVSVKPKKSKMVGSQGRARWATVMAANETISAVIEAAD